MSTRPTLAALLRTRSRPDVAAFVAALYAARDATTRVDSGGAVVDGDRYLVVGAGYVARLGTLLDARSPPPDVVVAVDPSRADGLGDRYGVPVVTPVDLDRLARYGLDRPVADRLFREHFDRDVDDVAPAGHAASGASSTPTTASPTVVRWSSTSTESAVLVLLVVAALVAVGVAAPSVGPGAVALGWGGTVESGAGPNETGVANEARPTPTTPTPEPVPDAFRLAPGLTVDGVVDSKALGDAHARAVANRSYTWELTYVEYANGNESGRAREVVSVERPTVYASRVTTDGFLTARGPVASHPSYADGDRRYRPTAAGVDATPIEQRGPTGLQATRAGQYYAVLLDGEESSVVRTVLGDPRLYVVDVTGTDASAVRNYTATAHVTPDGTVVYYAGSYCYVSARSDDAGEVCLSLTMQYRDVGETTVEPPAWYTEGSWPRATPVGGGETAMLTPTRTGTPTEGPTTTPGATTERRRAPNGTGSPAATVSTATASAAT